MDLQAKLLRGGELQFGDDGLKLANNRLVTLFGLNLVLYTLKDAHRATEKGERKIRRSKKTPKCYFLKGQSNLG